MIIGLFCRVSCISATWTTIPIILLNSYKLRTKSCINHTTSTFANPLPYSLQMRHLFTSALQARPMPTYVACLTREYQMQWGNAGDRGKCHLSLAFAFSSISHDSRNSSIHIEQLDQKDRSLEIKQRRISF